MFPLTCPFKSPKCQYHNIKEVLSLNDYYTNLDVYIKAMQTLPNLYLRISIYVHVYCGRTFVTVVPFFFLLFSKSYLYGSNFRGLPKTDKFETPKTNEISTNTKK